MLKRTGIRQKLLFLIAVPLIVVIAVTTLSILQLNSVADDMRTTLKEEGLAVTANVLNVDRDMYQALSVIQEMAAPDSRRTAAVLFEELKSNINQANERLINSERLISGTSHDWNSYKHPQSGLTVLENLDIAKSEFQVWSKTAEGMTFSNNFADVYDPQVIADFDAARNAINEINETMEIAMDSEADKISTTVFQSALVVVAVVILSFILVIILSITITNSIVRRMRKAGNMLDELSLGHLSTRVDVDKKDKDEIGRMINKMNQYADHLQQDFVANLKKISQGDLGCEINVSDEADEISPALQQTVDSLTLLVNEAQKLTKAAAAGQLQARGDASKLEGAYKAIVNGVNETLDGVTVPVEEAKAVLGRLAVNDLTVPMSENYQGMMSELAHDINQVRTNLIDLQDAIVRASQGDIRRLEEFRKRGQRSENDQLTPSVLAVYKSIQNIIRAAYELTKAATSGDLSKRADTEMFEGGYRRIVDGFNRTIDALVQPIQDAAQVIQSLAGGDLATSMDGEYEGDHAVLKNALNGAIDSFNQLLGAIRQASDEVATGSRELSNSSQTLSQGATEQASSIQEVTASIEQLANQTKANASSAGKASELSDQARASAIGGNSRMGKMLEAMNIINESSSSIGKIIKVIDDIAFQTNILALNAAVEAARAGQHGRGFAVVAEEVRNLAARSAQAAKETTALIEDSIKQVEDGTEIAQETAVSLKEIMDKVSLTNDLVKEISEASNEQASGIAQINTGLVQVSRVVQMNSATSEQSAAASEELSGQADLLREYVAQFRLKGDEPEYEEADDDENYETESDEN